MGDASESSTPHQLPRAQRFGIEMTIRYRGTDEMNWHEGRVENISRSGVLFRTQHLLEPKTPVEMKFMLPVEISNEAAAQVICSGSIVRAVPPAGGDTLPGLAAAIVDYVFLRGQPPADVSGA